MSQCNDIFTDKSIFRYFSRREIGQFQKTWAHFGENKTIRPHVTLVRAYECNWLLRFLWRSEFDIKLDRDKFKLKVDQSPKTSWQEYGVVGGFWWWAPDADYRRKPKQVLDIGHSPGQLSHSLAPWKDASKCTNYLLICKDILIRGSTL